MTLYATVDDALASMRAGTGSAATDKAILLNNLRTISRRVDRLFASRRPYFAPYIEQREMRVDGHHINSVDNTLRLDWPILAISAAVIGTTTLTIGTNIELWPTVTSPYRYLRNREGRLWYDYCTDNYEPLTLQVTGTWGYHSDYNNAWLSVTTLNGAINASVTSITLADIDGTDAYGRQPWISIGSLLQINSEWLEVTAVNTTTNVATVRRGVNGSTAAAHDSGATVSVYQVEDDLRDIVARQAGFKHARRGAYDTVTVSQLSTQQYPQDLLTELWNVLAGYAYE